MATTSVQSRTPVHFWIVSVLAVLWNCFGAYDYLMTRTHNLGYIAASMPGADPNAVIAWVEAMPMYAQVGWGLGVWGGLLGAVLMLLRSRYAVWSFAASLVGAVLSIGYQIVAAPPPPGGDSSSNMISYVIIAVAAALLAYSVAMAKRRLLR